MDYGFAFPSRRTAADLLERSTEDLAELRRNIQKRRQRERSVLELGMRHAKLGRYVRAALIPKQIEIDAAGPPPFARKTMTAKTTLGSEQDAQQLRRRERSLQAKRSVQVTRLRRPQGLRLVDCRDPPNLDPIARV
jgi:hypothetical protein